jgi:ceramide glucosyltransferase
MIHSIVRVIQFAAVFGAISSSLYYLLCLWSATAFLRERKAEERAAASVSAFMPPISILKPLKGIDPQIYECLRSHCLQDYPEYEIVFGVSDPADAAIASVQQLQLEFPTREIQLLVCPKVVGANVKVSNLAQLLAATRHDYLIVNDSDIRVEPDYLRRVIAPLEDLELGMVTCLYRGIAGPTLGSKLESLGVSTDFCAGVLAARQLEGGIHFGLGSTLAFRRADLEEIGGFESFVDHLADDYELGKRIAELGTAVKLSDVVVETLLPHYSMRQFFQHQLRWARAVRDSRAGGYLGLVFTFGLVWSVVAVLSAHGARFSWELLSATAALRLIVAMTVGKYVLRDRQVLRNLWLVPLRDVIAVGIWIASFAGHTVTWRGDRFFLKDGKLKRVSH